MNIYTNQLTMQLKLYGNMQNNLHMQNILERACTSTMQSTRQLRIQYCSASNAAYLRKYAPLVHVHYRVHSDPTDSHQRTTLTLLPNSWAAMVSFTKPLSDQVASLVSTMWYPLPYVTRMLARSYDTHCVRLFGGAGAAMDLGSTTWRKDQ